MSARSRRGVALGFAVATGVLGCSGTDHPRTDGSSGSGTGAAPNAGTTGSGSNAGSGSTVSVGGTGNGSGNGGTGPGPGAGTGTGGSSNAGAAGGAPLPTGVDPAALIPQRIRRLTNAEFDASVSVVTGTAKKLGVNFAPDARQSEYTVNDAQRVDNVTAKQIFAATQELAAEVKTKVTTLAPCATAAGSDECAKAFITSFGQRAFRRPLSAEEAAGLLTVYQTGKTDGTYADGIELVATAVLNSAGFLYLTELGSGPPATPSQAVAMTPYELANALSYLVTAGPANDQLVADAIAGKLDTPEGRADAFWALIGSPVARDRVVRIVREWVGVDRLAQTDKDTTVYGKFNGLKASMDAESVDFIVGVLQDQTSPTGGKIEALLANESTFAAADLKTWYAASVGGTTPPKRRGILNQAAFLSIFAHASESAPVLRGVEVARRVACLAVPSPTSLNIQVVPPQPDTTKTTRERFSVHATDAMCAACHKTIDAFGFAFEAYDGMGGFRTMDAGHPVNSAVTVAVSSDFDGAYSDSNQLAVALSKSAQVRACFARNMFRASAGRSDDSVAKSEEAFVKYWQALDPSEQGDILQTLVTYVKSPLFTHRRGS
ncbi:MAG TPA: DUF1588 domain-containing protein [Polyangiaceae bacterium]|nr:DUF1588 domain-containing protein [Polyangiaceae bacterium]